MGLRACACQRLTLSISELRSWVGGWVVGGWVGGWWVLNLKLMLTQPSLAGVGAGAELGKMKEMKEMKEMNEMNEMKEIKEILT